MATLEVVDYRTKIALEGLPGHLQKAVLQEVPEANQKVLVDFLYDLVTRENKSPNTKLMYVKHMLYLFRAVEHKAMSEIKRDDILSYLQSLRKTLPKDPQQKWISTHNTRAVMFVKFWKWLAYPELSPAERKKKVPDVYWDILLNMASLEGRDIEGRGVDELAAEFLKQYIIEEVTGDIHEGGYWGYLIANGWLEDLKDDPFYNKQTTPDGK